MYSPRLVACIQKMIRQYEDNNGLLKTAKYTCVTLSGGDIRTFFHPIRLSEKPQIGSDLHLKNQQISGKNSQYFWST